MSVEFAPQDFLWRELRGVPAPGGDERLKESARKILANSFGSSFREAISNGSQSFHHT